MKFIKQWLTSMFPRHRLTPSEQDVRNLQDTYRLVFNTAPGRELIEHWLESVVLDNPRSTDANECIAYATKCAFVEDIIKALDRANNPGKYEEATKAVGFNTRRAAYWARFTTSVESS